MNGGRIRICVLAAVLLAVSAFARAAFAQPAGFEVPHVERFQLSNGLDVVLERNERQPRIAVAMSYDVGSRDDPPGYAGLAYLVQNLTYRGSRHLGSYQGPELLEAAGAGEMNGVVDQDRTVYYAVVPAGALELALYIESERMAFTLEAFNDNALGLERSIVTNALRMRGSVRARFTAYVRQCLYGEGHPYSRLAYDRRDLDQIGLSDAIWFFQAGYRPARAHLIIVGNFEPSATRALITRYFGPVRNPASAPLARAVLEPASVVARRVEFLSHGFYDELVEVRPGPAAGASAHVPVEVFARILAHRLDSVLGERLGLTLDVSTELVDLAAGSELWISAKPRAGVSAAAIEQALDRELRDLTSAPLEESLRQTKAELRQAELQRFEDPLARAFAHLRAIATQGKPFDTLERLRALQAVTEPELRASALRLTTGPHVVGTLVRASPNRMLGPEGEVTFTP